MTPFDRLKILCDEQGISINKLEENIDLGRNTLYSWKKKIPSGANLLKVAEYFNVSTDYLLGRTEQKRYYDLTEKDEHDIQKELERMIKELSSNSSYAAFDGAAFNDLDEEDRELLIASLENTLRLSKRLAKQKFTPKKHR
jgi:transcriptional regulator with XRE-family HTH domain